MADSNNNSNQQQQDESTISYLPILFANGYPTSLEKMTIEQLELFIPFLVKCSLNLKMDDLPLEAPQWWPQSVIEYKVPFAKPNSFGKNWKEAMKTVITQCYDHHKQPFLLTYSKNLSEHDTANLRYIRDSNSTMALWSRNPKKLLLTFRNELMLYDRKKRRQLWKKENDSPEDSAEETEVIFLCDYCDVAFVSEEASKEHEKKCNDAPPENDEQEIENIVISDEEEYTEVDQTDTSRNQTDFMAYFFLASSTATELPRRSHNQIERSLSPRKKKKQAPRTRKVISQKDREKEFTIPFSSPAGSVLFKKTVDENYKLDKMDDIENYCSAKPNSKIPSRVKSRHQQSNTETYLMKAMRKTRAYCWPKCHLRSRNHETNFEFLNRWLIEDCRPMSIVVRKLSSDDITSYRAKLAKLKVERERANCVDLISDSDEEDAPVEVKESEINEAMMQMDGQFMTFPLIATTSLTRSIPKYADIPSFSAASSSLLQISRRTVVQTETVTTSSSILQNGHKRPVDGELHHDSKRSKTIHEWLNNVNGESFNQISHLVNS